MTEQGENSLEILLKVSSLDELKSAISPTITDKLADGDEGVEKTIGLLISLTPFAPAPATFDRDAFNNIVAVNYETGDPLPEEEQQRMLDVALEAGFIQKAETPKERYSVRKELQDVVKRVIGE